MYAWAGMWAGMSHNQWYTMLFYTAIQYSASRMKKYVWVEWELNTTEFWDAFKKTTPSDCTKVILF